MACTQIAPPSSQFPGGSCRDNVTGNNVDCSNSVCGNPDPSQAYSASTPALLAPAGQETYTSLAGQTQVLTLGFYMSQWVQGVIGFPTSISGLDPLTAALQAAQGYCAEAAGTLPDCTAANIQSYAAAAAAQIAPAVANNAANGGYAPPPGASTGGCGGVPCGTTTTAGAPMTNPTNGAAPGASNVPVINGSAPGQPPQTVQTGAAPIATKQGPVTGNRITATTPILTNAPPPNQLQAYQPTTGQTIVTRTPMTGTSLTSGAQTPTQIGTATATSAGNNSVILLAAVAVVILLWVVLEKK